MYDDYPSDPVESTEPSAAMVDAANAESRAIYRGMKAEWGRLPHSQRRTRLQGALFVRGEILGSLDRLAHHRDACARAIKTGGAPGPLNLDEAILNPFVSARALWRWIFVCGMEAGARMLGSSLVERMTGGHFRLLPDDPREYAWNATGDRAAHLPNVTFVPRPPEIQAPPVLPAVQLHAMPGFLAFADATEPPPGPTPEGTPNPSFQRADSAAKENHDAR